MARTTRTQRSAWFTTFAAVVPSINWGDAPGASSARSRLAEPRKRAGVIGKKFAYDLWGDAVNTASRMESHGVPGEIQISASTHEHVKDAFELESRGTIQVKGKGEMAVWFVRGRKGGLASAPG